MKSTSGVISARFTCSLNIKIFFRTHSFQNGKNPNKTTINNTELFSPAEEEIEINFTGKQNRLLYIWFLQWLIVYYRKTPILLQFWIVFSLCGYRWKLYGEKNKDIVLGAGKSWKPQFWVNSKRKKKVDICRQSYEYVACIRVADSS